MSGEDAMYEVTVDLPTLPKGELVQIVGLGTFENKGTYTVSKDQADSFRTLHAAQEDVRDDNGAVVGTKRVLGPTLLQAANNMYGVEVSTASGDTKAKGSSRSVTAGDDTSQTQNQKVNEPLTIEGKDAKTSKDGGDKS